jgi:hemolysin activation/secretion protein
VNLRLVACGLLFGIPFAPSLGHPQPAPKVRVDAVTFTGNTAVSTVELQNVIRPDLGKELSFDELRAMADRVTEVYRRRGFVTSRAFLPPQEVTGGVLEIAILEGHMGEVIVKGNRYYSSRFVDRHIRRLAEANIFDNQDLETALLRLNDHPDLKATAVLQAGSSPGATDIVVNIEDAFPLNLTLDYNNFGSEVVSRDRFGALLEWNRFLIEGSQLSVRVVSGTDPESLLFWRASYVVPISVLGTKAALGYASGDFDVGGEFRILQVRGEARSYDVALSHSFVRTRVHNLSAEVGFEAKDTELFILDGLLSRDKVRLVKSGVSYDRADRWGRALGSLSVILGLGEALGGMENDDLLASRQGADGRFTRVNLSLARFTRFSGLMALLLRATGQYATTSLVVGEQFSVGGPDSVRGYPQGELLGDDGFSIGGELRVSPVPTVDVVQLAFFIDYGWVAVKNPAAGADRENALTGTGVGLRFGVPSNGFRLPVLSHLMGRVDLGFPLDPKRTSSGDPMTVYVQVSMEF